MNIFECSKKKKAGGLQCIYRMIRRNAETGELVDYGCSRRLMDQYNIYPEFRSDGSIVNQDDSIIAEDFKVGPTIIYENISGMNQNGLSFDYRTFDADSHPLYHREERIVPTSHIIEADDVGEIAGGYDPFLVISSWGNERYYGHSRVERCNEGVYGRWDDRLGMVIPSCFKSYKRDIAGWIDVTKNEELVKPKSFFIEHASNTEIITFCEQFFEDIVIAHRIADALIQIRDGTYINILTLMKNNFVSNNIIKSFLDTVSTRTRKQLYKGWINIQRYCELYGFIDYFEWKEKKIDESGKFTEHYRKMNKDLARLFKGHLINWIINNPRMEFPNIDWKERYDTGSRYWFLTSIIKRGYKEGIVDPNKIPSWMINQLKEHKKAKKVIVMFEEEYDYNTAPDEVKRDFEDSIYLRLTGPEMLYPGMVRISKLLNVNTNNFAWVSFVDILNAGERWSTSEIQTAWDYYIRAFEMDDPSIFWNWIEEMVYRPYDSIHSITEKEFTKILDKTGGKALNTPSEFIETIEEGVLELNLGEYNITPSRAFAENVLECMVNKDSFEIQRRFFDKSYDARTRIKKSRESAKEVFWNMLAKHSPFKKDKENLSYLLTNETHLETTKLEEFIEESQNDTPTFDSSDDIGLDESDINSMYSIDPRFGITSPLSLGKEGQWQDEAE